MQRTHRFDLITIPLIFILAGIGMLWMLPFENPPNGFFEALRTNQATWVNAHIILLISTMMMSTASMTIRASIRGKIAHLIATVATLIVSTTSILLAGQYAIDFVMPFLANNGDAGIVIFREFRSTPMIETMFYGLPNLVFIGLMVLCITWAIDSDRDRIWKAIMVLNWSCVLLGNLIAPVFQRVSILLLAVSLLPFLITIWKEIED